MTVTMLSHHRVPRGGQQARNFSGWAFCLILVLATLSGRGSVDAEQVFGCESEEDLNGSTCRVDMLPDAALAQIVYDRGFDPEGVNRLQLVDAVMELLEYEDATGEDLREVEYVPDYDSAAGEDNTVAESAAVELEQAVPEVASGASVVDQEAEATRTTATMAGDESESKPDSGERNVGEEEAWFQFSAGGEYEDSEGEGGRAIKDAQPREEESACAMDGAGKTDMVEKLDERTMLGFVKGVGAEVLSTMKRDLNAIVGLLPDPVEKPIREVAAAVGDTAVRFVFPAMKQAERYTRGLRRGATAAAGKVALRLRDDVCPRVARGITATLGKVKRRVSRAVSRRGKEGPDERGGAEDGQRNHQEPEE